MQGTRGRLVVPCGGFFVATVVVVVFELSSAVGLSSLAVDSTLRQSLLLSSNSSSAVGLSSLAVDSLLQKSSLLSSKCLLR
jgi:hypothetical protein